MRSNCGFVIPAKAGIQKIPRNYRRAILAAALAACAATLTACWGGVWRPEAPAILRDYNKRGTTFLTAGDFDAALRSFNQALKEAQGKDDAMSEGYAYLNLARLFLSVADLQNAGAFTAKAHVIFERMGNREELAHAKLYFGSIARQAGKLDESEKHARDALEIFLELDKPEAVAAAYNNLALVLIAQGKLKEAEDALEEAEDFNGDDKDRRHTSAIYSARADLELSRKNLDKAVQWLAKALEHDRKMQNVYAVANDLARLAAALEKAPDPDTGMIADCYLRAFRVNMTMKLAARAEKDLQNLSRILTPLGRADELKLYVEQLSALKDELERRGSPLSAP